MLSSTAIYYLHTVKWFQAMLLRLIIQFNINNLFTQFVSSIVND